MKSKWTDDEPYESWAHDIAPEDDAVYDTYFFRRAQAEKKAKAEPTYQRRRAVCSGVPQLTGAEKTRRNVYMGVIKANLAGWDGAAKRARDLRAVALGDPTHGPALRRLMTLAGVGVRL